ncbi:redoxin family protein [Anaerococcus sp. ENR0831]|uniref:Redoxin family protein n=1 Tax=Anaerococcus martiniensis TaxID=3115615 RepID=A0ABW9MA73_9FIRM
MKKLILLAIFALSLTLSSCDQQNKEDIDDQKLQAENQVEENINQQIKNEKEIEDEKETESEDSIVLEDKDGNPVSLADYKGKKTFVEFWASWCPICLTGLEQLDQLSKNASDYNIVSVVSPGLLGEMPKDEFIEWFDDLGHENIEVIFDTNGEFIDEFNIRSTPTNVFLNSDGDVEKVLPGQMPEEMIKEILAEFE